MDRDDWRGVKLHRAAAIERVCAVYEIAEPRRLPNGGYKIKVVERAADFMAIPNVCVKDAAGDPQWICGLGATALEALQDAIDRTESDLSARDFWEDEQLEWSDPRDF